ncbi:hypothetical protein BDR04DRAFT_1162432 [Suillus decipiens]|nr:hypothetical protein BDR04DRAFT_1162432 [Suillus decipiens]
MVAKLGMVGENAEIDKDDEEVFAMMAGVTVVEMSLSILFNIPPTMNNDTISRILAANNPQPLRGIGDNADYWVNDAGEIFTFKFPVSIDLGSEFDRSGAYINLPYAGLDLMALKKMHTQFELHSLDATATKAFPEEAIRCSSAILDMLNVLHGKVEDARNTYNHPQ